jgi:hypothetical protein
MPRMRGRQKIVKKIQMLGVALVAMFAFSALVASVAFAEPTLLAEWLIGGQSVLTLTLAKYTFSALLSDTSNGSDVVCSWVYDGSVGPNGEAEVTEVLTLAGTVVTLTAPLKCESAAVCEKSTTDVEVIPENLPWHLLLVLMESNGKFLEIWIGFANTIDCLVLGLKITDECQSENAAVEVSNVTGGVEAAEEALTPLGSCSIGGAGTGEFVPLKGNLLTTTSGELLTMSSEP